MDRKPGYKLINGSYHELITDESEVFEKFGSALRFSEPSRTNYINTIIELIENVETKERVRRSFQRLDLAKPPILGFSGIDAQVNYLRFCNDTYEVLGDDDCLLFIDFLLSSINYQCMLIETDLKSKVYKTEEERKIDKDKHYTDYQYLKYLELIVQRFEAAGTLDSNRLTTIQPPKNVISLFCNLLATIPIVIRDEDESEAQYCNRVCAMFGLEYTDKVRQLFKDDKLTKKRKSELKSKLLPLIDSKTADEVSKYLDNIPPSKPDLYA